jgi:hypothetical protein
MEANSPSVAVTQAFLDELNDIAGIHAMAPTGIIKMAEFAATLPAPLALEAFRAPPQSYYDWVDATLARQPEDRSAPTPSQASTDDSVSAGADDCATNYRGVAHKRP